MVYHIQNHWFCGTKVCWVLCHGTPFAVATDRIRPSTSAETLAYLYHNKNDTNYVPGPEDEQQNYVNMTEPIDKADEEETYVVEAAGGQQNVTGGELSASSVVVGASPPQDDDSVSEQEDTASPRPQRPSIAMTEEEVEMEPMPEESRAENVGDSMQGQNDTELRGRRRSRARGSGGSRTAQIRRERTYSVNDDFPRDAPEEYETTY